MTAHTLIIPNGPAVAIGRIHYEHDADGTRRCRLFDADGRDLGIHIMRDGLLVPADEQGGDDDGA